MDGSIRTKPDWIWLDGSPWSPNWFQVVMEFVFMYSWHIVTHLTFTMEKHEKRQGRPANCLQISRMCGWLPPEAPHFLHLSVGETSIRLNCDEHLELWAGRLIWEKPSVNDIGWTNLVWNQWKLWVFFVKQWNLWILCQWGLRCRWVQRCQNP